MKIEDILISNFRGISHVQAEGLGDTVIVAGQNGSGKSCLYDAVRLLKSTYGGYQQNEWQQFFGEFQIQLTGGARHMRGLFNDEAKSCLISVNFKLRDREKAYITENAAELLEETIWQALLPEAFQYGGYHKALFAAQFRDRQPEVNNRVQNELPMLMEELSRPTALAKIEIYSSGKFTIENSKLLGVVFSNYRPRKIGVIDFHGAQRHYGRENVSGINLNLEQTNMQYSQSSLYNYNAKYANVKSEMAGNYVKELLAEKASGAETAGEAFPLTRTLTELFESFFPEKKFLGPQPTADGSLSFPVVTQGGTQHDLDELSSGEKEILYGYLRIRSSAPRDSIILLDEPELHLNPRLIRGLPEFYRKHLGEALENQLWLVTHSDALIREAVGKPGFNVFHMLPCGTVPMGESQMKPLNVSGDLESVLADLVGDLAAYRPGGKALIFEGGGDTDFDKAMTSALFASELRGVNLISGTNKARVRLLHEVLDRAYQAGDLPTKFYAITDGDSDGSPQTEAVNRFCWDVYHIENYLLDPEIIAWALRSISSSKNVTAGQVMADLEASARKVVPQLLIHRLRVSANSLLVGGIDLGFPPDTLTPASELHAAVRRSVQRIQAVLEHGLSENEIEERERRHRQEIEQCFSDGTWIRKIPGRDILRRFVGDQAPSVGYDVLRNMVLSRMVEIGSQPEGMKAIISRIADD